MAEIEKEWPFSVHWYSVLRKGEFANFLTRVNSIGLRVGTTNQKELADEAADLSSTMLDLEDMLRTRQAIFFKMRETTSLMQLGTHDLTDDEWTILVLAPPDVLANMITTELTRVIERSTVDDLTCCTRAVLLMIYLLQ